LTPTTLGAAVQVALQHLGREELARALQHQVHAQLAPGNVGRLRVGAEAYRAAVDLQAVFTRGADVGAPTALHAVELQQVRRGRGAALDLVAVHHLQAVGTARVVVRALGRAHRGAQRQAADATHAVDADFHARLHV
jgi:hypothetical protein